MTPAANQRIVVTGASSGIGREIAIQLSAPGCNIWLMGRNRERLEETAIEVRNRGATAEIIAIDLSDLDEVEVLLKETFPVDVSLDSVYLGAAITSFGEVQYVLNEDWDALYRINLLSPIQLCRHFYGNMVEWKRGNIVLISSLAAYAGYPTATAYATMKAGLLGLYRSLWYEGKAHGVSIHHVALGYVRTGIYKTAIYRNTSYEKTMESIDRLGFGILSAEDAAKAIIKGVTLGKREFAVPLYASVMKWISPRVPVLIEKIHGRILHIHRRLS